MKDFCINRFFVGNTCRRFAEWAWLNSLQKGRKTPAQNDMPAKSMEPSLCWWQIGTGGKRCKTQIVERDKKITLDIRCKNVLFPVEKSWFCLRGAQYSVRALATQELPTVDECVWIWSLNSVIQKWYCVDAVWLIQCEHLHLHYTKIVDTGFSCTCVSGSPALLIRNYYQFCRVKEERRTSH